MVAISKTILRAFPGVDLEVAIRYTPPEGETIDDLEFRAVLAAPRMTEIEASEVRVDQSTGTIVAVWSELATAHMPVGASYDARVIRSREGATRVIYIRRVQVQ